MSAEELLSRLQQVRRNGSGWIALCPAHDDRSPSLSVREGDGGRVLLHCHAGCTAEQVCAALGLTVRDLMPLRENGRHAAPVRPPIMATYRYADEHGALLFEVVRMQPKSFRQRRPDGRGGWVWNLDGVRRVPYRLPEVAEAAKRGRAAFIVEGEKDADALASVGLTATTCPGGAGKWLGEYAECLRGAHVVVLPDNDEPGRKHAEQVARSLSGVAASVRVVELPDLPPKGDVSDWLAAGGNAKELKRLARETPLYVPTDESPCDPAADDWPEPIPLDVAHDLPGFPVEALPQVLGRFAVELAEELQVPNDLTGLGVLAACAVACARTAVVEGGPGWREPLCLYLCAAYPSGGRKSAAVAAIAEPILQREAEATERERPGVARRRSDRQALEHRADALRKKAARTDDPNARAELEEEARELAARLATTPVPMEPRFLADDATPERLAGLLAEQGGRIGVLSPEGAGLFEQVAGRYSDCPNLEVVLKAHAGDPIRVDRVGRPSEHVRDPAATLLLMVQPGVLRSLASRTAFRERGLLARFLWSVPTSRIGFRDLTPPPVSPSARDAYHALIGRLLERCLMPSADAPVLRLDADAAAAFLAFRARAEAWLRPGGRFEGLQDWCSKLPGLVLRVAALMHLTYHDDGRPIDRETMRAAQAIGDYAAAHAEAAFAAMGSDERMEGARELLDWLLRAEVRRFSVRDAMRACRRFQTAQEVEAPLQMLEERGWVRPVEGAERAGPGRKPSPEYEVNPAGQKGQTGQNAHFVLSVLSVRASDSAKTSGPEPSSRCAQCGGEAFGFEVCDECDPFAGDAVGREREMSDAS